MEFMCVLSVGGSLASYLVQKEEEGKYTAVLRTTGGRTDVPGQITLIKTGTEWKGEPAQDEIVRGLVNAIEASAKSST